MNEHTRRSSTCRMTCLRIDTSAIGCLETKHTRGMMFQPFRKPCARRPGSAGLAVGLASGVAERMNAANQLDRHVGTCRRLWAFASAETIR
jgi:hypothetical protein